MKSQHAFLLTCLAFVPVPLRAVESVEIEPKSPGHSITWLAEKLRPYQIEMSLVPLRDVTSAPIIAPFWADADTTITPPDHPDPWTVTYGPGTVDGEDAFGVNWVDVGYYAGNVDKLNSSQLVLIDRSSDGGTGDFDIEFNYNQIAWDEGDATSDFDDGYGDGHSPRAGLSDKHGVLMEAFGSGIDRRFLDTIVDATRTDTGIKNYANGLIYRSHRNPVFCPGRFLIRFRNGVPLDDHLTVDAGDDPSAKHPLWTTFQLAGSAHHSTGFYGVLYVDGRDILRRNDSDNRIAVTSAPTSQWRAALKLQRSSCLRNPAAAKWSYTQRTP